MYLILMLYLDGSEPAIPPPVGAKLGTLHKMEPREVPRKVQTRARRPIHPQ
ncbi:MAG: hypothetical protein JWM54_746 [Acidobacteriaceae bacterium]|nr:hypothetical protein [Acidobacteriaceae bacterium]